MRQNKTTVTQTVTEKLSPTRQDFQGYTVSEASKILGLTRKTILSYCASGTLLSVTVPYGSKTTYLIPLNGINLYKYQQDQLARKAEQERKQTNIKTQSVVKIVKPDLPQKLYVDKWVKAL
jgi:hypothetical protein